MFCVGLSENVYGTQRGFTKVRDFVPFVRIHTFGGGLSRKTWQMSESFVMETTPYCMSKA